MSGGRVDRWLPRGRRFSASLLPADADHEKFLHALGIHGDPVATRRKIDAARRRGKRFKGKAYSYPRAFGYTPDPDDKKWLRAMLGDSPDKFSVLDPTAGGGSIPFEVVRFGGEPIANDLNPVSALIMSATVEWPSRFGSGLRSEFEQLSERFIRTREERLARWFPLEPKSDAVSTNFIWARTIHLSLLRRSRAAVAQLAAGTRRDWSSVEA